MVLGIEDRFGVGAAFDCIVATELDQGRFCSQCAIPENHIDGGVQHPSAIFRDLGRISFHSNQFM
jgi:hypothetical protein